MKDFNNIVGRLRSVETTNFMYFCSQLVSIQRENTATRLAFTLDMFR